MHFCWSDWTGAARQQPQGQGTTLEQPGRLEHFAQAENGFLKPGNPPGLPRLDGGRCRDRTCDPSRVKGVPCYDNVLIFICLRPS